MQRILCTWSELLKLRAPFLMIAAGSRVGVLCLPLELGLSGTRITRTGVDGWMDGSVSAMVSLVPLLQQQGYFD